MLADRGTANNQNCINIRIKMGQADRWTDVMQLLYTYC